MVDNSSRDAWKRIKEPFKGRTPIQKVLKMYYDFYKDAKKYFSMEGAEKFEFGNLYPMLFEKTETHTIRDYSYFYQDTWGARKVFEGRPASHVDIGSSLMLVAILSQFTKVCSIDVRPIPANLEGLTSKKGNITDMPFKDNELESISSLCVLEHIGLGRYGDPIDARGTDNAIAELKRVLKPGGNLYVSVPIWKDAVFFNAHRTFDYNNFIAKNAPLSLIESRIIYGARMITPEEYLSKHSDAMCVGLFHFRK